MTAEEFYDWCHRDENRDRNFELVSGKVVEVPLTEFLEGIVCSTVGWVLGTFTHKNGVGHVCTNNVGIILERNPDTVLGPDVSLFLDHRKFRELDVGYTTHLPVLAVEVWASCDQWAKTLMRLRKFLECGIPMVWLLKPEMRMLTVFRPNEEPHSLFGNQIVTGMDILPGFTCNVSEFFKTSSE